MLFFLNDIKSYSQRLFSYDQEKEQSFFLTFDTLFQLTSMEISNPSVEDFVW